MVISTLFFILLVFIGFIKRFPWMSLCSGYVFFFYLFATFILFSAQITNSLFLVDACEQIREVVFDYDFPQYNAGLGYYSSCLPLEANADVVEVLYQCESEAEKAVVAYNAGVAESERVASHKEATAADTDANLASAYQLSLAIDSLNDL